MANVLVADDHALIRSGLAQLLQQLDEDVQVFEAATALEALEIAHRHPELDVLLLDLRLPDADGLSALRRCVSELPLLPVIVLSASELPSDAQHALDEGAMGYIPKSADPEVTLAAIRQVLAGDIYVPELLSRHAASSADDGVASLTPRQRAVLVRLAAGRPNKSIARELGMAEATVKVHVTAILKALGASNRTEAAQLAHRLGLVDDDGRHG